MRRRFLSGRELDQVIRLKQAGASWLKIQDNTGVPRRSAKRAYEEWERSKSSDELKKARVDVAAEEFRHHLDDLVALAQSVANYLYTPHPIDEIGSADDFLESLWRKDIRGGKQPNLGQKEERRVVRQNKMLFESLQEHTREKVRWEAFEEWKQALSSYAWHSKLLRSEAQQVLRGILHQERELARRIEAEGGGENTIRDMVTGVVEAVWRAILAGKPAEEHVYIATSSLGERGMQVSFGKQASRTLLLFPDEKLAEEVAKVCKWAAVNLCRGEKASVLLEIGNDISRMEERAREIEQMLDGLILRPVILRTRCELCPA